MDRESLDRKVEEIVARAVGQKEVDKKRELRTLRKGGYSPVESAYILTKSYAISLGEAKELIVQVESESGKWEGMEDFHESISDL